MGIAEAKVPRPGVFRWEGLKGVPGAYKLTGPNGADHGTFWPEAEVPGGMHHRLTDLAEQLNHDEGLPACRLCAGTDGPVCPACKREHDELDR